MPYSNPITTQEQQDLARYNPLHPRDGSANELYMPPAYFLVPPATQAGPVKWRLFDAAYISTGIIDPNRLGTGAVGLGNLYLADDGTWKSVATAGGNLPPGGTTGQLLAKINNTDYNVEWIDNYALWTSQVKHEVKAAEVLLKGQAVYVSSADGTNMIVSKASNAAESTSSKTMGLVAQDLAVNGKGFVITEGLLAGLDTSMAAAGDPVWLGTNGALLFGLANKPVAPAHMVFLGIVTRAQAVNGEIFVKVQNGFEIEELHNVLITSKANKDLLYYDSASALWKNGTFTTIFGGTPLTTIPTLAQVTTAGNTTTNSISVGGITSSNNILMSTDATYSIGSAWSTSGNRPLNVYVSNALYAEYIRSTGIDASWLGNSEINLRTVGVSSSGYTVGLASSTRSGGSSSGGGINSRQPLLMSSGTSTYYHFNVGSTYNLTGGTNTIIGFRYDPTLTSITGTTHIGFNNTTGNNWLNSTSGNTLIGTTTDAGYKLDVNGNVAVRGNLYMNDASNRTIYGVNGTYINLYNGGTGGVEIYGLGGTAENKIYGGLRVTGNLITQGSFSMNGNLDIGNGNTVGAVSNAIRLYRGSDASMQFYLGHPTVGDFIWQYPENTTLMTLKRGGNLLVGTTTDAGYKLDVNGSFRSNGDSYVTSANGRVFGFDGLTAGQTLHFQYGGDSNHRISTTHGSATQMDVYHGLIIRTSPASGGKALIVNQRNSAHFIQEWQENGTQKAYINSQGNLYLAQLDAGADGPVISTSGLLSSVAGYTGTVTIQQPAPLPPINIDVQNGIIVNVF